MIQRTQKVLLLLLVCAVILTPLQPFARESGDTKADAFQFQFTYTGDNLYNFSGGIQTGFNYLGMANFILDFDTEKARIWKGGQFKINATNTHGATPSEQLIGDIQIASNIEAGNHTFLQELWYKQTFGSLEFIIGLQNLNAQFANTEHGMLFINSSFGIHSTIAGNIPAPIYPLTSLGFTAKWMANERISWSAALFNGCRKDFDQNPYNLNWQFNSDDGILGIAEMHYIISPNNLPGTYKFGYYNHHHFTEETGVSDVPLNACLNNHGFYVVADQMLWRRDSGKEGLGMFLQFSISPEKINENFLYAGAGINYHGLFGKCKNDILGLAFAHAGLKSDVGSETAIELTYKTQLTNNIFIQPDIQYIINPANAGVQLENSTVGILRLGIQF